MKKKLFVYLILIIYVLFIILPITVNAKDKHWAKPQVEKLMNNYHVREVFIDKNYDSPISIQNFKYLVHEIIDKEYNAIPPNVTREAIVSELVKIWADQKGQSLANIPEINMFIYYDRDKIDEKYRKAVILAYRKGIAKGRSLGTFAPNKKVTYGELAVLLKNTKSAIDKQELKKEKDIIQPEKARDIIKNRADKVMNAIKNKDFKLLSGYIHPDKGVRFTPYTYVSIKEDIVFSKAKIEAFFQDNKKYLWGYYDGSGKEIRMTPGEYYQEFIYSKSFMNAEKVGYNAVLSKGNKLENQFEVYENSIIVEYYLPGNKEKYSGMDWESLRLVFERQKGEWLLTGIIHNEWTI